MGLKKEEIIRFSLFLRAGCAEPVPPLGTILGNYGASSVAFCKDYNDSTKALPNYFYLETHIEINLDKTLRFRIKKPGLSLLIKLLTKTYIVGVQESGGLKDHIVKVLYLSDIYKICLFHFGEINYENVQTVIGSIGSFDYFLVYDFV